MFDVLVSKYIDGILTPEEDRELRAILSDNPLAKEQFNLAVSLHIAMTDTEEDSQLDNIVLQTETQLFEKLHINAPKQSVGSSSISLGGATVQTYVPDKPIRKQRRVIRGARIPLVVTLFLLFVNVVSDSLFTGGIGRFSDSLDDANKSLSNNTMAQVGLDIVNTSVPLVQNIHEVENEVTSIALNSESTIEESNSTQNLSSQVLNSVSPDTLLFLPFSTAISSINNSTFGRNNSTTNVTTSNTTNVTTSKMNTKSTDLGKEITIATKNIDINSQNGISPDAALINNTDIPSPIVLAGNNSENSVQKGEGKLHIGSFLNNGFVYANNNKATASSFSQSIGYGVTSSTKIGLEMGRVGYSYSQQPSSNIDGNTAGLNRANTVAVNSSKNVSSIMGKEDNNGNEDIKLNSSSNSSSSSQDVAVVWGGAFVEQMIVNTSDFDVNVRGGIGVAGDGAVIFARTYAEYKLSSFMSVTFGGEGKNFTIRNASRSEKPLSSNYMIGLVYGLQIKF